MGQVVATGTFGRDLNIGLCNADAKYQALATGTFARNLNIGLHNATTSCMVPKSEPCTSCCASASFATGVPSSCCTCHLMVSCGLYWRCGPSFRPKRGCTTCWNHSDEKCILCSFRRGCICRWENLPATC